MRFRNASRPFHAIERASSKPSSSRTLKGGKAPGKLAVARAAKTSSAGGARCPGSCPRVEKPMVMRCSVSLTSDGLLRRNFSRWPWKSVTVTNRSSGCPAGNNGRVTPCCFMACSASSSSAENPVPPNGGWNHRARTKPDSLVATSSCASLETVCSTVPPRLRNTAQAIGAAQNLENRDSGRASGSSSTSTSAFCSQRSVNGSSDCPVTTACERKTPLIPPALAPAMISVSTRSLVPDFASMSCSSSRYTSSLPPPAGWSSRKALLARTRCQISRVMPCM